MSARCLLLLVPLALAATASSAAPRDSLNLAGRDFVRLELAVGEKRTVISMLIMARPSSRPTAEFGKRLGLPERNAAPSSFARRSIAWGGAHRRRTFAALAS